MFSRLKDWRRVATRYDRCPNVFFSTVALATTVIFWLDQRVLTLDSGRSGAHRRALGRSLGGFIVNRPTECRD